MAENEEAGQKDSSFHELWQRLPAHQIDPVRWFLVLVEIDQESKRLLSPFDSTGTRLKVEQLKIAIS